jgi:hypothetical protein
MQSSKVGPGHTSCMLICSAMHCVQANNSQE